MKLYGALLILSASLAAALFLLREERNRLRSVAALQRGLRALRGTLAERQTPLPAAFRELSVQTEDAAVRAFFAALAHNMERLGEESFSVLWRAAAADRLAALGADTAERLALLGEQLGGSELERQCKALDKCADALETLTAQAAGRRAEKRRMTLGLSLSLGAFLVILLL